MLGRHDGLSRASWDSLGPFIAEVVIPDPVSFQFHNENPRNQFVERQRENILDKLKIQFEQIPEFTAQ